MTPIGLYVHIPFCVRKCFYCDFASVAGRLEILPAYLHALETELRLQAARYPDCIVETVFVGGGTPSLLPPDAYGPLMEGIRAVFAIAPDAEISLETNPGTLNAEKASAMREAGFNRVSLGVQAVQDALLASMGRIHRRAEAEEAVRLLWDAGFRNLNLDLMFGMPEQTFEHWEESLAFALATPATHLSFYSLSIEEDTPWGELYRTRRLEPAPDELDRRMYHHARRRLVDAGFVHYEISNAAKPGLPCRHNLIYWNRGDYLGIGAGAHSLMSGERLSHASDPDAYIRSLACGGSIQSEVLAATAEDVLAERLFMGLRLLEGIDIALVSQETGIDVAVRHADSLDELEREALILRTGSRIRLSEHGLDFANRVFRAFL